MIHDLESELICQASSKRVLPWIPKQCMHASFTARPPQPMRGKRLDTSHLETAQVDTFDVHDCLYEGCQGFGISEGATPHQGRGGIIAKINSLVIWRALHPTWADCQSAASHLGRGGNIVILMLW